MPAGEGSGGDRLRALTEEILALPEIETYGRVAAVQGLLVEIAGPVHAMRIGSRVRIDDAGSSTVECEVVGFRDDRAICMPFSHLEGVRMGCRAVLVAEEAAVRPSRGWLGRVVDARGMPIDGKGPLPPGGVSRHLRAAPPPAHARSRVGAPIELGVRALNTFLTCCKGQRMGIFAGSGVGKSVLFSMLARNSGSDVAVIGLIGERGREVQEFIEDDLGPEGLARAVVVVATSDETALMRRQAAWLTMTLAEHFRDEGDDVLCLMDSITRFAMSQREIGLAGGEPPTAKGYTPTVFSELPRLLERAGPGTGAGSITGLFTVLVEGDDHNEPVSDAVRAIVDGHIVMERSVAERGRFPAINVLKSVSRTMPRSADPDYLPAIHKARRLMATFADMEELIRLGAYRRGSDPMVDEAIERHEALEAFLAQGRFETTTINEGYEQLARIVSGEAVEAAQTHGSHELMKSRENLIRIKRFQVDEKRRQVTQIETMVADFERMADELERQIVEEQTRVGVHDITHFAYPTFAKAAMVRRDNLRQSADGLKEQLAAAQAVLAEAFEDLKKVELLEERNMTAERQEEQRRSQSELDAIGLQMHLRTG